MILNGMQKRMAFEGSAVTRFRWPGIIAVMLGLLMPLLICGPVKARAAELDGPVTAEFPLVTGPGDQINPDVHDGEVVFDDRGKADTGWIVRKLVAGVLAEPVAGPGVAAGPAIDSGFIAWLKLDGAACLTIAGNGAEDCVALPEPAESLAFSGDKALTSHGDKVIRLVNFDTGRTKVLDSSTTAGNRYDPDIRGDRATWVKDRGYAGKYYEPLIVDYDLMSDTYVYLTAAGGGASSTGESKYERANPVLGASNVIYQQRLREAGEQWDIFRAVPDTFGEPLVTAPGDQVNPAIEGNTIVYQDNRSGYYNESGAWVGEWDLYLKNLDTGSEIPLCLAAGDQVNPHISGNLVVWQDNRAGDWDIYGAVMEDIADPVLAARVEDVFWADYAAFQSRELTVRYSFSNKGSGTADAFSLRQVQTIPASVTVTSLPGTAEKIMPGGAVQLDVGFNVPQGVTLFKTLLFASCLNSSGEELWFPRKPAAA